MPKFYGKIEQLESEVNILKEKNITIESKLETYRTLIAQLLKADLQTEMAKNIKEETQPDTLDNWIERENKKKDENE